MLSKRRACVLIRETPEIRRDAFVEGLTRLGFEILDDVVQDPRPSDLLVIWTRHEARHGEHAAAFEAAGAPVMVAENGYIGSFREGGTYYALALNEHNGNGVWPEGGPERLERLEAEFGITFKPWRDDGGRVVITEQRGIGSRVTASPANWHSDVAARLRRFTEREIEIRRHPGKNKAEVPFVEAIKGAWCLVTWASNCATAALLEGIPVFYEAPSVILAGAAEKGIDNVEAPLLGDRRAAFERLAWAQWNLREISTGEPFERLLACR